jgi:UDPglucose 6-dehydrogenase
VKLSVFGLGHIGLVNAAGFASLGFQVKGYDIDPVRVRMLKSGDLPMFEPHLKRLVMSGIIKRKLSFIEDYYDAVLSSDLSFVTVNTPLAENGNIDFKPIISSLKMIGEGIRKKNRYHFVVIRSTVPPGSTSGIIKDTLEKETGKKAYEDFGLAVNPEFMREANAVHDFFKADRIIIGVNDKRSERVLQEIYSSFKCPKLITNFNNAEMIKQSVNSFSAMAISFTNMIANICQHIPGADIETVVEGMGFDKKIPPQLFRPSPGWGGSCWPKDNVSLLNLATALNVRASLIQSTLEINEEQPFQVIKIAENVLGSLKDKRIAVLGLAYKANTDDVRGTISKKIVEVLLEKGATVSVYDPSAESYFEKAFNFNGKAIEYAQSEYDCIRNAECAIIVTSWEQFKKITADEYVGMMKFPFVIDGVRIYDHREYSQKLNYRAMGLGP